MINSSSLFHFTKEFEIFKQILTDGLRFSYCYEPYGDIVAKQGLDIEFKRGSKKLECKGIAIPMISFCDTPLLRTQRHRERYGNYIIGFNRDELIKVVNSTNNYILNPVQYRCHSIFDRQLEELSRQKCSLFEQIVSSEIPNSEIEISHTRTREDLKFCNLIMRPDIREKYKREIKIINAIDGIIGFSKPFQKKCGYDYMEEREWRIIVPDCSRPTSELGWRKYISEEDFESFNIKLKNQYPHDLYLHLGEASITSLLTHIVVSKENERNKLIHFIQNNGNNVFGRMLSESQKSNLISKITSFEQIEKDY